MKIRIKPIVKKKPQPDKLIDVIGNTAVIVRAFPSFEIAKKFEGVIVNEALDVTGFLKERELKAKVKEDALIKQNNKQKEIIINKQNEINNIQALNNKQNETLNKFKSINKEQDKTKNELNSLKEEQNKINNRLITIQDKKQDKEINKLQTANEEQDKEINNLKTINIKRDKDINILLTTMDKLLDYIASANPLTKQQQGFIKEFKDNK